MIEVQNPKIAKFIYKNRHLSINCAHITKQKFRFQRRNEGEDIAEHLDTLLEQ